MSNSLGILFVTPEAHPLVKTGGLGDVGGALDVVQDAFIKVHKHLGNFKGNASFYTWLYRIVMNLAIDHVRKARKITNFDDWYESSAKNESSVAILRQMLELSLDLEAESDE